MIDFSRKWQIFSVIGLGIVFLVLIGIYGYLKILLKEQAKPSESETSYSKNIVIEGPYTYKNKSDVSGDKVTVAVEGVLVEKRSGELVVERQGETAIIPYTQSTVVNQLTLDGRFIPSLVDEIEIGDSLTLHSQGDQSITFQKLP